MNLLFLADAYLPHAGGSRVYYHNLYSRIAQQPGNRVTVLTTLVPGSGDFDAAVGSESFRIIRSSHPLDSWKYHRVHEFLCPLLRSLRVALAARPDMIHTGDLYPQGVIGLALKKMLGIPFAAYCHGEEITQADRHRTECRMRDAIYMHADLVIAASEFSVANLQRIGVREGKIAKVTPGVDWHRFTPGTGSDGIFRRFKLEGKLVLLTVARLVPRKGHARVIDAVAQLAARIPNLVYLVVGCGPEEGALRRLARVKGIEHLVHFAGFVPDEDLPEYYRACDIMVMPNSDSSGDIEGFGMVFLEANAAGKPVVGGRSGGTSEPVLHGETGYLVDPENPHELLAALDRLLNNAELRERMGRCGMYRARKEFDWNSRANAVLRLTEAVVRRNPGAASRSVEGAFAADCDRVLRSGHES